MFLLISHVFSSLKIAFSHPCWSGNWKLLPGLMKVILLKNPFQRSIPSKIKLTGARSSIGTDSIWLALPNLKLASVDWHFQRIACLTGPSMFSSDQKKKLKKSGVFWVLFWIVESKNTLNLLPDNLLSISGTLATKGSANRDTQVLHRCHDYQAFQHT